MLKSQRVHQKFDLLKSKSSDSIQLIKSSGSVGANYIEAKEGLSNKDYFYCIKICKKEARESTFWLKLVDTGEDRALENDRNSLINESIELSKIFWSIAKKEINSTQKLTH